MVARFYIIYIEKDGVVELDCPYTEAAESHKTDRSLLNVGDIVEFAQIVDLNDVRETISRQIEYNMAISQAGMNSSPPVLSIIDAPLTCIANLFSLTIGVISNPEATPYPPILNRSLSICC